MTLFRPIYKNSWRLVWAKPWTLLFGFVAAFWGASGFRDMLLNARGERETATATVMMIIETIRTGAIFSTPWHVLQGAARSPFSAFIGLLLISASAAVIVLLFWLSGVAQSALIDTSRKYRRSLKTNLRAAWMVGRRFGWRLFSMHITIKVLLGILMLVIGGVTALTIGSPIQTVVGFISILCITLGTLIASLAAMYTANAIVLRDYGLWEGLRFACALFNRYRLISVEMAAISIVLQLVFGLAGILISSIITIPFFFLFLIAQSTVLPFPFEAVLSIWMILTVAVLAALTALLSAWQTVAWSELFFELTEQKENPPRSALLRLIRVIR